MNISSQNVFEDEMALSATTITLALIELFSSSVLLSIVHWEKYGGDPQKRTLVNQLMSYICLSVFANIIIKDFLVLTRMVWGCLHPFFGKGLMSFFEQ